MNDFILRDEMPKLKVSILIRILDKYYQIESNDEKVKNEDMNDFLFKYLDQHGIKASILFNKVDFGEEQIKLIHRLFHDYQDKFDFSFLNYKLAKAAFRMINDMNKQKEEYSNLFSEMKKEIELKEEEIKRMKVEENRKYIEYEENERKRKEEYAKEIEKAENLFKSFLSLVKISIPTSVTSIDAKSFSGCLSLKEINIPPTIPSSVRTIESKSFKGCRKFE